MTQDTKPKTPKQIIAEITEASSKAADKEYTYLTKTFEAPPRHIHQNVAEAMLLIVAPYLEAMMTEVQCKTYTTNLSVNDSTGNLRLTVDANYTPVEAKHIN